jgi:hypothetical protein
LQEYTPAVDDDRRHTVTEPLVPPIEDKHGGSIS